MDKERLNPVRNIKDSILKSKISNGIKNMPDLPGVYMMKGEDGVILYIGKAASLKKRVLSYFRQDARLSSRIRLMAEKIRDIYFIVTSSEAEALIAESALIKQYRPRYNIALKDDKSYPYLKLTENEEFPRLVLTRKTPKILGSAAGAQAGKDEKAVYYGPYTDVKLLRKALTAMKRIFPLRTCRRMPKRVCLNYRLGQCYGPCIQAVDRQSYGEIVKELKLFLKGKREKLIEELSKKMQEKAEERDYEKAAILRDRMKALSVVPSGRRPGGQIPQKEASKERRPYDEIVALKYLLGLRRVPRKIEAFDISNISGREAVGSMVTFADGLPSKGEYRKFKIRGVKGIDDYKMMKEVIKRRYERVKRERLATPDLIVIDGGKGQLNTASDTLKELGFERVPVVGIAKRFEHIYLQARKEPIIFSRHSSVLHLIQRMRDEAHRFAISYHRGLRSTALRDSVLDGIRGIGDKRKILLLKRFGSVENIRKAGIKELSSLKGINEGVARKIKEVLA